MEFWFYKPIATAKKKSTAAEMTKNFNKTFLVEHSMLQLNGFRVSVDVTRCHFVVLILDKTNRIIAKQLTHLALTVINEFELIIVFGNLFVTKHFSILNCRKTKLDIRNFNND